MKALAIREGLKIEIHQAKSRYELAGIAIRFAPLQPLAVLLHSDVHSHLKRHTLFDRVACLRINLPRVALRASEKYFSSTPISLFSALQIQRLQKVDHAIRHAHPKNPRTFALNGFGDFLKIRQHRFRAFFGCSRLPLANSRPSTKAGKIVALVIMTVYGYFTANP